MRLWLNTKRRQSAIPIPNGRQKTEVHSGTKVSVSHADKSRHLVAATCIRQVHGLLPCTVQSKWPCERIPVILETQAHTPLVCHPNDAANPVTTHHVIKAGELHVVLSTIPRKNPVWEALRAMWAGLTMDPVDHRYPFFWMALEALFGPNDSGETAFKLCLRIGFFLGGDNHQIARDIFKMAKTCYGMRSKIIHGRWKDDPKIDGVMADTEAIARTALRRVIENPDMLRVFMSKDRDGFLRTLSSATLARFPTESCWTMTFGTRTTQRAPDRAAKLCRWSSM